MRPNRTARRLFAAAFLPALALAAAAPAETTTPALCAGSSLGKGVNLAETTAIAALVADPESWVGKSVRVEGRVTEVCERAGCWMTLAPNGSEAAGADEIKVKVKDGVIVFPVSARGKAAVAQGEVERLEMNRGKYVRYRKHLAEEQGKSFDEAAIQGDGPFHVYQIAGTGAQLCD